MNLEALAAFAPEKCEHIGFIWPIYFEPMTGTGEKIVIAVVVKSSSEKFDVVTTLSDKLIKCMFGNDREHTHYLIETIVHSLKDHLFNNYPVSEWSAPFNGVYLSRIPSKSKYNGDFKDLIEIALYSSSYFSSKINLEALGEKAVVHIAQDWFSNIKANVIQLKHPDLAKNFNYKIRIGEKSTLKYDYFSDKYAFKVVDAVYSRPGNMIRHAKECAHDLSVLDKLSQKKDNGLSGNIVLPKKREIVLIHPIFSSEFDISNNDKFLEKKDEIKRIAEMSGISVFETDRSSDGTKVMANRLIGYAAS